MPSITISKRSYFYQDCGEGLPFLLFHGFPFSSESFWPQLEKPPVGVRLLMPDHRGFGQSSLGNDSTTTMEDMAEDGLALLDALSLPTAIVGGLSMGGYVAIALTRLNPGRVRGLCLIDTQSLPDNDETRLKRETAAQDAEQHGVDGLVDSMLPRLMSKSASPQVKERVKKMMRSQPKGAVAAASRGMATRLDGKDILSRFFGPCTIVVGEEDAITPVEKAKVMHELVKGSTLDVIAHAGHLSNLEQPEAFGKSVERLITACR